VVGGNIGEGQLNLMSKIEIAPQFSVLWFYFIIQKITTSYVELMGNSIKDLII